MEILKHIRNKRFQDEVARCFIASSAVALLTVVCYQLQLNLATASLLYVVAIVFVSRAGSLASSIIASIAASLCLAYIAPPAYSFRVDDPFDVMAIATFLITSLVLTQLVFRLRRMAEEAISSVDRRLLEAQERERTWIARELHDDFSQRLALVSVNLERLLADPSRLEPAARQCLKGTQEQILNLSSDIQALSHHLHSSKLQYLGIVAAARGFCREISEKHLLHIDVQCEEVPENLPENVGLCLFRVLQEALQNAVKHSKSEHFEVRLRGMPRGIELEVHDTGVGFDAEAAKKSRGLGLISMQERIKLLKGEFSIASQVNHGTLIHASVPVSSGHGPQIEPRKGGALTLRWR